MLIDVHAHIDYEQFDLDRPEIIKRAKSEDILIINSGLNVEGGKKTLDLSREFDNVYATIGLPPTEILDEDVNNVIELIEEYKDEIVAIGEVGLDYYWVKEEEKRKKEIKNFRKFIELSKKINLPLVIHSRDAEDDTLKLLDEYHIKALLHCFGGDAKKAVEASEKGHLISIPANLVKSRVRQEVVKAVPLESLVLETDAPYLAPVPKTRNEPVNIKITAKKIAEIKNIDYSVVEETTTRTAKKFFNVP
jgi:TatD DNase family protein